MAKALLLFLGLLSFGAHAQTPATPAPSTLELSAGRRDTLGAVANLYERRRKGGRTWIYIGLGGSLAFVRALSGTSTDTNSPVGTVRTRPNTGGLALVFGTFVGIPAAIGIGKVSRFSEAKENEVDRAYRSGQPLPRSISRRLAKKDF